MSRPSLPPPPRPDRAPVPGRPDLPVAPARRPHAVVRGITVGVGVLLVLGGLVSLQERETPSGSSAREEAPPASTEGPAFRFFAKTGGGRPIRWNPCQPIRYQIDLGPMSDDAAADIHEAFAEMSRATGIGFVFAGFTQVDIFDRLSDRDFVTGGPDGGLSWAPILVAWRPRETLLGFGANRDVIGLGLPIASRLDRGQFVTGVMVLNADARLRAGFDSGFDRGPLILHELAHVIGLGHVRDRSQLMFRRSVGWVTGFGEGDLEGLERLGTDAGCLVMPEAELDAALVPPVLGRQRAHALP